MERSSGGRTEEFRKPVLHQPIGCYRTATVITQYDVQIERMHGNYSNVRTQTLTASSLAAVRIVRCALVCSHGRVIRIRCLHNFDYLAGVIRTRLMSLNLRC